MRTARGPARGAQVQVMGAPVVLRRLNVPFPLGQISYILPFGSYLPSGPPPTPQKSARKRTTGDHNSAKPYIKKPPNAFMLFLKEQRPLIQAEIINSGTLPKDSATVNKILGMMWKSLAPNEKEKYFNESERLNDIHAKMYPDWSCRNNYGKKKKREWCHAAKSFNYPTASPPEVHVQAHGPCKCTCRCKKREDLKADLVSTHFDEAIPTSSSSLPSPAMESVMAYPPSLPSPAIESVMESPPSLPSTSIPQAKPNEDLILTLLNNLGNVEASQWDEASTSSLSSTCTVTPHGVEEDLTSALFKELEALEAAEASFSSSSTCTNSPHEDDLTSTLFKELEALEAAEAANASSASFWSWSSCSTYSVE
ncbi:transcription factor 7-like 1-B isoform X2 [Hippocampus comes]|uniref:transcription factor 7-like 1-B isoform X2 n=1 Tax=Hippocampus comes TaxID=109280 RepID=UPI00094E41F0|nr:PREDICTED: transcription factor 7-like 1-B isoform X2 [Hippocampus comes]